MPNYIKEKILFRGADLLIGEDCGLLVPLRIAPVLNWRERRKFNDEQESAKRVTCETSSYSWHEVVLATQCIGRYVIYSYHRRHMDLVANKPLVAAII